MKCQARQVSDQMRCEQCRLVWDMNDPDPPTCGQVGTKEKEQPFARVRCNRNTDDGFSLNCGAVGLTEQQYETQLVNAWKPWRCPQCGDDASFDDEYFEERHGITQGVHPEEETRNNLSDAPQEYGVVGPPEAVRNWCPHYSMPIAPGMTGCPDCNAEPGHSTVSFKGRDIIAKTAAILGVPVLEPLMCYGVSRIHNNEQSLAVAFNRVPTDAELQHVHDLLRHNMPKKPR